MSGQTAIQKINGNSMTAREMPHQQAAERSPWSYLPKIDVMEYKDEYVILCDAPGLSAEQFELHFESGSLHIHGPVPQRYPSGTRMLRQEYGVGDFDREIPLGRLVEFVDVDRVSAEYAQGVLTIHLPKLAAVQPKRIEVKAS